jgi:hypothetical protein
MRSFPVTCEIVTVMIRGRWHRRSRSLNVHPDAEKHRKGDLRMLQVSLTAAVVAAV